VREKKGARGKVRAGPEIVETLFRRVIAFTVGYYITFLPRGR
jgi:hypothetical protein